MNIVLTNHSATPQPVMSRDEGGWAEELIGNGTLIVAHTNSDVIVVGDKPDVVEAVKKVGRAFATLIEKIKGAVHADPKSQSLTSDVGVLNVTVRNDGPKTVRVILGDAQIYNDLPTGGSYDAIAPHYLEIREMGNVQQDPNQHEAA